MNEVRVLAGREYLDAVTRILQEARLADPTGGLWEAADLHWWWRADRHEDPDNQRVWFDGDVPVAAASFSRWGELWGADLLGRADVVATLADDLWDFVGHRHHEAPVDMLLREDDQVGHAAARTGRFGAQETPLRIAWRDATSPPTAAGLPEGYTLTSYGGGTHWMALRNGDEVAERLAETGLYRPDLDLAVVHAGEVVAYALFWADPVTGVGLVEPMRVEEEHAGRGLAGALLAAGLQRLADLGCIRFKVSFDPSNTAAARLYLGAGFLPVARARLFRRAARNSG